MADSYVIEGGRGNNIDRGYRRHDVRNRELFNRAIAAFRDDVTALAAGGVWDAEVRIKYQSTIQQMATDLRNKAKTGSISWKQAADEASQIRNQTMNMLRGKSTPIGRAIAQSMKAQGLSFNQLIAKYAIKRHGANVIFDQLTDAQKGQVYRDIVEAAGRSNPKVNIWAKRISRAGKGLIVLSLAISVYNVATAEDKMDAALEEGVTLGAGIAGGAAGGALAGLACGPGAPVCVTIGAFVGGAAAAFGVSLFW